MGDYNYALEKLTATVESLAEGEGTLRERLFDAYLSQGMRLEEIDGGTRLSDLRERWASLRTLLTDSAPDQGEGTIHSSIQALSEEQVRQAVAEIIAVFHNITELYWVQRGAS